MYNNFTLDTFRTSFNTLDTFQRYLILRAMEHQRRALDHGDLTRGEALTLPVVRLAHVHRVRIRCGFARRDELRPHLTRSRRVRALRSGSGSETLGFGVRNISAFIMFDELVCGGVTQFSRKATDYLKILLFKNKTWFQNEIWSMIFH